MLSWLAQFAPVVQALLATLFTWFVTALGAALVLFTKTVNRRLLDTMLGMAAGVMVAASFWSLLAPAIELSAGSVWPALIGFLLGGAALRGIDRVLPHVHPALRAAEVEGVHTSWRRSTLLVLAVTLHNIPEGLAVGVAFGAAAAGMAEGSLAGAVALAIGIGLHGRAGRSLRADDAVPAALRAQLRSGRDDLRGGGGADPRIAKRLRDAHVHLGRDARFCGDDAAGRGVRVTKDEEQAS